MTAGTRSIPRKQILKWDFGGCLPTIQVSTKTSSLMVGVELIVPC